MLRRRFLILSSLLLAVIVSSALFVSRAFVYDAVITHPGLTKQAAQLYNQENNLQLSTEEIGWLALGSIEEDTPIRWMNHFYDPVHNIGLSGAYDSAKKWSKNASGQINFAKGNKTWQQAIYNYQVGNKQEAFIILGHIMHLLEDMTVPAHTRDDPHPEGDPYEKWTRNNYKELQATSIYFNSLDRYFDYLANYSNNNFYSKDTVEANEFNEIKIVDTKVLLDENNKYYKYYFGATLDGIKYPLYYSLDGPDLNWLSGIERQKIVKGVDKDIILSSHFSILAPKAIGAGAGVIKLFFEETQKQQNYKPPFWKITPVGIIQEGLGGFVASAEKNIVTSADQFANLWDATKDMVTHFGEKQTNIKFITELWKTHEALAQGFTDIKQNAQDVANIPTKITEEVISDVVESFSKPKPKPVVNNNQPKEVPSQIAKVEPVIPEPPVAPAQPTLPQVISAPVKPVVPVSYGGGGSTANPVVVNVDNSNNEIIQTPAGSNTAPNTLPDTTTSSTEIIEPELSTSTPEIIIDTTPPAAPIILDPVSNISTTSSSYVINGLISADTFKLLLNNQETVTSGTSFGVTAQLTQGLNNFNFVAVDDANNYSATTSVDIIYDILPPVATINALSNINDRTKIDVTWSSEDVSGSGTAYYVVEYQSKNLATSSSTGWVMWQENSTSTAAQFNGEENFEYIFRVKAIDNLENISAWQESEKKLILPPNVVINEIAWGGSGAGFNDEWIELFNNSDFAVDLTGWVLSDGNDINIHFSSSSVVKIPAYGFYLLERTSDNTVLNRAADYVYTGALKDGGEKLELKNKFGLIMDLVDCKSKWFAGRNDYDKESMERVSVAVAGSIASNWKSSVRLASSDRDALNNILVGTPKHINSTITFLTGILNADRTLTAAESPYFLSYYTIASGTVLSINPGVTIIGGRSAAMQVYGQVNSLGTAEKPIIFTSYNDASLTEKYNLSLEKNWSQIVVYPGATINLKYVNLLNGLSNHSIQTPKSLIYAEGANVTLENVDAKGDAKMGDRFLAQFKDTNFTVSNSHLYDSYQGIEIVRGGGSITDSIFENMDYKAIEASDCKNCLLENNTFKNNGWKYTTYPMLVTRSSVSFRDYFPKLKNNIWDNNFVNAPDWIGEIKATGTLTLDFAIEQPLVVQSLTIPVGLALTIPEGSILKMSKKVSIDVKGILNVLGTETKPVIFTSVRDDESGGDTNLGDIKTLNADGNEWSQLTFNQSGTSTINYLILNYANDVSVPAAGIYINKSTVIFDHLKLLNTRMPGNAILLVDADGVMIKNSLIKNLTKRDESLGLAGIYIKSGSPYLDNITIDTHDYGIMVDYGVKPQFGPAGITYLNVHFESFGLPVIPIDIPE